MGLFCSSHTPEIKDNKFRAVLNWVRDNLRDSLHIYTKYACSGIIIIQHTSASSE